MRGPEIYGIILTIVVYIIIYKAWRQTKK